MRWYLNDLSLSGQFLDHNEFRAALEPLLRLRATNQSVQERLYCSKNLTSRPVTENLRFDEAVYRLSDRTFITLVLSWVTKHGPFWSDDRCDNPDDYFEFAGQDVTDQGLGEASRRTLADTVAGVFSFKKSEYGFEFTPVVVSHGLQEEPLGQVPVQNCWDLANLEQSCTQALGFPTSWPGLLERAEEQFRGLVISNNILEFLEPYPYASHIAERTIELLSVLDRIVMYSDENGRLSDEGMRLYQEHFVGRKAWFSAESETNMRDFSNELTFRDPLDTSKTLCCHWHGKIKSPQYRIHFEWPRPEGQQKIKVTYIGPKITKA